MSIAKLEHIDLYYEVHGTGEPVIFIADLLESSQSWHFIINTLSKHFKLILFDNRGIGKSNGISASFSVKDMAGDTVALMDHLKLKKAHIVGHGLGGFIGQEIAINHPERVEKLVLEATAPNSNQRCNQLLKHFHKLLESKTDLNLWLRNYFFWIYSAKFLENSEFIDALIEFNLNYSIPNYADAFKLQINSLENFDSTEKLNLIHSETLIIIGEEDIMTIPSDSEKLYQGINMASYPVYFEKTGHSVHNENPKNYIHTLLGFFLKYDR